MSHLEKGPVEINRWAGSASAVMQDADTVLVCNGNRECESKAVEVHPS